MRIELATNETQIVSAAPLFDHSPSEQAVDRFLREETHHLLLSYVDDVKQPVGFVSGVEVTHPDKGTEMFLYELAVSDSHRRRGIGTALVRALADLARKRGCYGMWVLTGTDNGNAISTYTKAGATEWSTERMAVWTW